MAVLKKPHIVIWSKVLFILYDYVDFLPLIYHFDVALQPATKNC
jgi:hypothetical protein